MKPISEWSAAGLRMQCSKAHNKLSDIRDELIACGRGSETDSEIMSKTDDLSKRFIDGKMRVFEVEMQRKGRLAYHGSLEPIK